MTADRATAIAANENVRAEPYPVARLLNDIYDVLHESHLLSMRDYNPRKDPSRTIELTDNDLLSLLSDLPLTIQVLQGIYTTTSKKRILSLGAGST